MILSAALSITDTCAAQSSGRGNMENRVRNNYPDEAEARRRLDNDDNDAVALTAIGSASLKEGDKKSAIKYLRKAVAADLSYPNAHFYLGKAYYTAGNFDGAAEEFDRFTDLMKRLPLNENDRIQYIGMLHDISQICMTVKRYDEAYKALADILRLSPNDQVAVYNLGVYYYVYERSRSLAYQSFLKAIRIDPNTGTARRAQYAIEFMRNNPDPRIEPDFSFLNRE